MLPASRRIWFAFIVYVVGCQLSVEVVLAQNSIKLVSINDGSSGASPEEPADPVETELALLGEPGQLIARARTGVLSILTEDNACSAWFRQALPDPAEQFRTLRFALDTAGPSEIFRREVTYGNVEYIHPYVARATQDVGPGSTITINTHGAFFENYARVHFSLGSTDLIQNNFGRQLIVGDFGGGTTRARILTLLHEFGHVVNLLPVDSGTPASAFISVQNTKTVLRHCKSRIETEAKPATKSRTGDFIIPVAIVVQETRLLPNRWPGYFLLQPRQ
ncbi:MAG TPA: hypothetical protein VN025_01175 [Candidatus Dormibacteraeota bacterium]|jgi:hypothetical protein|nr:hypothetical protein [Candidatus Dormibacteraeota bacterium]